LSLLPFSRHVLPLHPDLKGVSGDADAFWPELQGRELPLLYQLSNRHVADT